MRLSMERLNQKRMHRSGDACECASCQGHYVVYSTEVVGENRVRYLRCNECKETPADSKWIVPLMYAPEMPRRELE